MGNYPTYAHNILMTYESCCNDGDKMKTTDACIAICTNGTQMCVHRGKGDTRHPITQTNTNLVCGKLLLHEWLVEVVD